MKIFAKITFINQNQLKKMSFYMFFINTWQKGCSFINTLNFIILIWAFRLAALAVGLSAATPQSEGYGAHGRGQ